MRGEVSTGEFSEVLLKMGDGEYPESKGKVTISVDLDTVVMTLADLMVTTYSDITSITESSMDWLCEYTILTSKNDKAAIINEKHK